MGYVKTAFSAAIVYAAACACAHAAGSGEVIHEGKTTQLTSAYAYRQADQFHTKKMVTVVILSTKPIDTAQANASAYPIREVLLQLNNAQATYVELDIAADGSFEQLGFFGPGLSLSGGSNDKPVLKRNEDNSIEGTFRTKDAREKTDEFGAYYDLKFALDIPPAAPTKP